MASFNMSGGLETPVISDNTAGVGGGLSVLYGSLTMNGGTISNNRAEGGAVADIGDDGGGVYVCGGAYTVGQNGLPEFFPSSTMTGGTIKGNTATGDGGGVCIVGGTIYPTSPSVYEYIPSSFIMEGGLIGGAAGGDDANTAGGAGGGVYIGVLSTVPIGAPKMPASLTMRDGDIKGNAATIGGGVYVAGGTSLQLPPTELLINALFTMEGGTVGGDVPATDSNTAIQGGGVFVGNGGKFNMRAGAISGNTAVGDTNSKGGGVHVEEGASFTIPGNDCKISGNHSTYYGAGVYVGGPDASFVISGNGCEIKGNNGSDGGGVYVRDSGAFTISGASCVISGNEVTYAGGGVV
jgi:hypothetical protein